MKSLNFEKNIEFATPLWYILLFSKNKYKVSMNIIYVNDRYELDFYWCLFNKLLEEEFTQFIVDEVSEREAIIIINKRIEVSATEEFDALLKSSIFKSCKSQSM